MAVTCGVASLSQTGKQMTAGQGVAFVSEARVATYVHDRHLMADGLIYTSSMVMLDVVRRKASVPALARWPLGLSIAATLAASVAHGLGHGPAGAAAAAWPAVALIGSCELFMIVICSSQTEPAGVTDSADNLDPPDDQAAEIFAEQLTADRVPSICAVRAQLHVGQPNAQRLHDYFPAGTARRAGSPAARATRWKASSHGRSSS